MMELRRGSHSQEKPKVVQLILQTKLCRRDFFSYYLIAIVCFAMIFFVYNFSSSDNGEFSSNVIQTSSNSGGIRGGDNQLVQNDDGKFAKVLPELADDLVETQPRATDRSPVEQPVKEDLSLKQVLSSNELLADLDFTAGLTEEQFNQRCMQPTDKSIGRSIADVYDKVISLQTSQDPVCQNILKTFENLFNFERISTTLKLPTTFQDQVKAWLGNNEDLFKQIYNQQVYKVICKLTGEETIFNLLRSKRPLTKTGIQPVEYVENLTLTTAATCDFCKYREHTAEDVFGRVETKYSATASNTFKLAKFHGLFFPLSHHPLNISYNALEDLFLKTSVEWFQKAHKLDSSQRYASLLWDSLPHAGASQIHPHVHGLLDNKHYAGKFETIHQNSKTYYKLHGRSIWSDFVNVHLAMGLGLREGDAVVIVPIGARKDHEYWIISETLNENVIKLLYRILKTYREKLNTFCHSSAAVYPPLKQKSEVYDNKSMDGLPVIFRIGSRGDCTSDRSDVSSLELYTVNNINSNIAQTIDALKSTGLGESPR